MSTPNQHKHPIQKKSLSLNVTFKPLPRTKPYSLIITNALNVQTIVYIVVFICTLFSCPYDRDVHIIVVLYVDLVHLFHYAVIITSFDFLLPQLTRNSSFEIYQNPGIT